jgi:hypothetical protein
MSDTPETDALYAQMLAENPGNFIHLEEFLELACRLEQERDAALMDRASGDIATMTRNHYERLIKERDEARSDAAKIADILSGLELRTTEELAMLGRERNKALTTIEDAKRALNATDYEDILLAALRVKEERDEARQRASDLALGVKV